MNMRKDRVAEFQRLHSAGCFVMPNPWDVGSARALERMGFKALATTSAGLAWTLGTADTHVTRDQALDHRRLISGAVGVPVNADFEGGYVTPDDPDEFESVLRERAHLEGGNARQLKARSSDLVRSAPPLGKAAFMRAPGCDW